MKVIVLVDNNTFIDKYFLGEPGFCAFIEDENTRILFDVGYSDVFIKNANKLHIDLAAIDYLAISHGHLDHTWGLVNLIRYYSEKFFMNEKVIIPVIIGHPETFCGISDEHYAEIGSLLSERRLQKYFKLSLKKEPQKITDKITYLGEIPRRNSFEGTRTFGKKDGKDINDNVPEDSALVYKATNGLVIITGCSHSGICNIIEYAKQITGENRILDIVGGFHLLNPSQEQIEGTVKYLMIQDIEKMHPCHCTDLKSIVRLSSIVDVEESGVGLELEYK